jgi:threonylcarbamoyladenosine tRNA methylthiotransferase MtaB
MKSLFRNKGNKIVADYSEADAVIINSCTVTSSGDSRVLAALRKIRAARPDAVIALTGCYPQAFRDEAEKITDADIIIGTKNRSEIVKMVDDFFVFGRKIISLSDYSKSDEYECLTCTQFDDNTRAFVKIQDGCNQFCSYCIIPYARGRCRSKPLDILKNEAAQIAQNGKKEIVLSGINLAFYGKDTDFNLADAAEICAGTDGIERVRLGSLEPEMMSDELLERLAAIPELCPQFHLSLQSGCTRTLKAMNRKYTAEEYLALTERIRNHFPECSFTTDIMVGFPGETDEDFEESRRFVEKIGFSRVHVFRYSRRKGTAADKMAEQIPENIKSKRWHIMTETSEKIKSEYMRRQIGKNVPVLFERENCTEFHHGFAPDYTLIKIPRENPKKSLRNMIFCVKIEESESDCCKGKITAEPLG